MSYDVDNNSSNNTRYLVASQRRDDTSWQLFDNLAAATILEQDKLNNTGTYMRADDTGFRKTNESTPMSREIYKGSCSFEGWQVKNTVSPKLAQIELTCHSTCLSGRASECK
jgi:hypothetical protein